MTKETNPTNKFMFFSNFLEAINQLSDEKMRYKTCYEFCRYGITGELPSDEMIRMFCLGVEASVHKYQGRGGARKGAGRPKSEENQEDNSNQNIQKNQKNQNTQTETETESKTESQRESKEKVSGSDTAISKDTSLVPAPASNQEDLFGTDCSTYAGKNINQQRCLSTSSTDDDTFPDYLRNKYKWEGSVIKLVEKDFVAWQSLYPNIDLRRELENRDDWLSKQPEKIQKSWFLSTKKYLEKLNKEAA